MEACERGETATIVIGWGEANPGEDGIEMAETLDML